jgi:hypothetical protein
MPSLRCPGRRTSSGSREFPPAPRLRPRWPQTAPCYFPPMTKLDIIIPGPELESTTALASKDLHPHSTGTLTCYRTRVLFIGVRNLRRQRILHRRLPSQSHCMPQQRHRRIAYHRQRVRPTAISSSHRPPARRNPHQSSRDRGFASRSPGPGSHIRSRTPICRGRNATRPCKLEGPAS